MSCGAYVDVSSAFATKEQRMRYIYALLWMLAFCQYVQAADQKSKPIASGADGCNPMDVTKCDITNIAPTGAIDKKTFENLTVKNNSFIINTPNGNSFLVLPLKK